MWACLNRPEKKSLRFLQIICLASEHSRLMERIEMRRINGEDRIIMASGLREFFCSVKNQRRPELLLYVRRRRLWAGGEVWMLFHVFAAAPPARLGLGL